MKSLINLAVERIKHFQYALSLYENYLLNDVSFQNTFLQLLDELLETERTHKTFKQVFFVAVGKSAGIARLAVSMFVSVGLPVQFLHPTEAFHGDLGSINKGDTVIFISNGGNSSELLQLLPGLQSRNVNTYAFTTHPDSPLGSEVNYTLSLPPVEEKCPLDQSPITSTITSLALCQLLVAASIEKREYPIENYAQNHPGGSIGKRIFLKVDDMMAKGSSLPTIGPDESFQSTISIFTSFAKACLIVIDSNQKLLGLIAERDLRIAMEKFGPNVFDKTSKDLMNTNPKTIHSNALAINALNIMTKTQPILNVLPVISSDNTTIGVVQLRDLLALGLKKLNQEFEQ